MIQQKISVIMASFLGEYEGSASNREEKFQRAVDSFLKQSHPEKELLICSDGCEKTNLIFETLYSKNENIKLIRLEKQPLFSGNVREAGLKAATGKIVCYLDADDFFGVNHLSNINSVFAVNPGYQWVYFNDFIYRGENANPRTFPKYVTLEHGSIGTSSIAHFTSLRESGLNWSGCDKYSHDWIFIQRLIKDFKRFKKVFGCSYYICHLPNLHDV